MHFSNLYTFEPLSTYNFRKKSKIFKCENGGKFDNLVIHTLLDSHILHIHFSCWKNPNKMENSNGWSITNNFIRTLIFSRTSSPNLLGTITKLCNNQHLLNLLQSKSINNDIPFAKLCNKQLLYSHFYIFCYLYYPQKYNNHNLEPRFTLSIFLGYLSHHLRHLDLSSNRIIISHHLIFEESIFPFALVAPTI